MPAKLLNAAGQVRSDSDGSAVRTGSISDDGGSGVGRLCACPTPSTSALPSACGNAREHSQRRRSQDGAQSPAASERTSLALTHFSQ